MRSHEKDKFPDENEVYIDVIERAELNAARKFRADLLDILDL